MPRFDLPPPDLLRQQAAWLAPARARLLRRVGVARRQRVLDLACGGGAVTAELTRRSGGRVVALDRDRHALTAEPEPFDRVLRVCGRAERLPFAGGRFDLVFCQMALMWLDAAAAVREIRRILAPAGVLVAIEPDYGGMIEHPPRLATRELWTAGLARAGADPCIGRKLPGLLADAGLRPRVELLDRLVPPSPARLRLLHGLPLTEEELERLRRIESADAACDGPARVVHLPFFLITAAR